MTVIAPDASGWTVLSRGITGQQRQGFNLHIGQGWGTGSNYMDKLRSINARVWRDSISWGTAEPSAGNYVFSPTGSAASQQIFAALARVASQNYDIAYIPVMAYGNGPVYAEDSTSAIWQGHFADYVHEICSQMYTRGYTNFSPEIWNEPNLTNFSTHYDSISEVPDLVALIAASYTKVKSVNAGLQVTAPTVADPMWGGGYSAWTSAFLSAPGCAAAVDAFSLHYYGNGQPQKEPEELYALIKQTCDFVKSQWGLGKKLHLTETGYFTGNTFYALTQAKQAEYYSRYPFLLRAVPLEYITYYALRDDGADGGSNNSFGVFLNDGSTPKTSAAAVTAAFGHVHAANNASYRKKGVIQAVHMTVPGSGSRLAVWQTTGSVQSATFKINSPSSGTLTIETIGVSSTTQALTTGSNTVTISPAKTAIVLSANVGIVFPEM